MSYDLYVDDDYWKATEGNAKAALRCTTHGSPVRGYI